MSSVLRARRNAETETGAGGKIVRGRRYAAAAVHPYRRPESPPRSESPRWISGLLAPAWTIASGAGKLLSFAFGSSSPSESSSSSSSDSDDVEDDDDSEDDDAYSKEIEKSNLNGTTLVSTDEHPLTAQLRAQKSESKRAIEHLLLQETFTRDECTELMKIIQSRVVDCSTRKEGEDATQKELHGRTVGNDITFSGAWQSSLQFGKSPEAYPYSMNGLSALSPGSSALRGHTPNLCDVAIMEAKKWLEEKKLEPCSNSDRDHGHCSLGTDVLRQVTEADMASPVDMAKSYMRSRPPWASPSWKNIECKTPPVGILHYADESSHSVARYSLPSTKELKRNSLSIGPWGTIEETRRVRLKSTDDIVDYHSCKQIDSSATMFNNKATQTLPVSDKEEVLWTHDSSSLPVANSVDASPKFPAELAVDESCQNGILHPSDENAVEVNLLATNHVMDRTNSPTSIKNISESEEIAGAEYLRNGISLAASLPSETEQSGSEKGISASHPIILISDKSEELGEAQVTKDLVSSELTSHKFSLPDSIALQHDSAREMLNSEPEFGLLERDGSLLPCDVDGVSDHNNMCASSPLVGYQGGKTAQTENTLLLHESPGLEEAYSFLGSISQGDDHKQNDANGLGNSGGVNGFLFYETSLSNALNTEPQPKPPDETAQNSTSSDHGELAVPKPGDSCELLSEASLEVPATNETNTFSDELQNDTSKTMNEAPLIQPQKKLSTARTGMRGRKAGYSRKGKGRGK